MSLLDALKDDKQRRAVIDDCVVILNKEVSSKRGLSGMAVKAAFKTVKRISPSFVPRAMDHLLDEFAEKAQPFFLRSREAAGDTETFFVAHAKEIADALLEVTDRKASNAKSTVVAKTYKKLRPTAVHHVSAAMPALAGLFDKYEA